MADFLWRHVPASIIGVATAAVVTPAIAQDQLPVQRIADLANRVTVAIESAEGEDLGSGFIISRESDVYYLLTAEHVLDSTDGEGRAVTSDDQSHSLNPDTYRPLPGVDLAIVQFSSSGNYPVAELGNSDRATVGTEVYVAGYPHPSTTLPERTFQFPGGNITARPSNLGEGREGYGIVYDVVTRRGMSGGPVFDRQGQVVGVHGLAEEDIDDPEKRGSGFNLATPIALFRERAPQVYLDQGAELLAASNYAGAQAAFRQAIRFNPTSGRPYGAMAYAAFGSGNVEEAIDLATRAIDAGGTAADYRVRGAAYFRRADFRRAIADLSRAASGDGRAIDYGLLGLAYAKTGEFRDANENASRAISSEPDNPLAYALRAEIRTLTGDSSGAADDRARADELSQESFDAYDLALAQGLQVDVPADVTPPSVADRPEPAPAPEPAPIPEPAPLPEPEPGPLAASPSPAPPFEGGPQAQAAVGSIASVLQRQREVRGAGTRFDRRVRPEPASDYDFAIRTTTRGVFYYALPEQPDLHAFVGAVFLHHEAGGRDRDPEMVSITCRAIAPGRQRPADPRYLPPDLRCGEETVPIAPGNSAGDGAGAAVPVSTPTTVGAAIPPAASGPIDLVEACQSFQDLPHQIEALELLEQRIPRETAVQFGSRWRTNVVLVAQREPVSVVSACRYFGDRHHQAEALRWLQNQLAQSDAESLEAFANLWRQ